MPKKDFLLKKPDDIQQLLIHKNLENSMIVSGCAGSGKSNIALIKAQQIQNEVGDDYQIIVFTKSLYNYMNSARKILKLNGRFTYYWHWKNKLGCPVSDYVIVDEIQDFTSDEINEFIKATKKHFFFFGDTAQSIFDGLKQTESIENIAKKTGLLPTVLYFNHRLPIPVAKITDEHIGIDTQFFEPTYKSSENSIPRIVSYLDYDKQIEAIARIIKTQNLTDVGIFFPSNIQVKKASEVLTKKGINNEVKFDDKEDWHNSRDTLNFETSNPKLMTYHSAKGLQFETVFLPDCTIENDGKGFSKQKQLYVAMTRTYKNLYVLHSNDLTSFIENNVPKNLYTTNEFDEIEDI